MNSERVIGGFTAAAILADMLRANGEEDVIPAGWKSVKEWAEFLGKSAPHTNRLCRLSHERGLMERKMFRRRDGDGAVRPKPHFKFIGKAARPSPARKSRA